MATDSTLHPQLQDASSYPGGLADVTTPWNHWLRTQVSAYPFLIRISPGKN
jgi:hypothetical protein